jgi:tetratricopeptide (TPR) repeat protein
MKRRFKDSISRLFSGRDTIQHFLLNRWEKGKIVQETQAAVPLASPDSARRFPRGEARDVFIQRAMDRLADISSFGAMAIKLDAIRPPALIEHADEPAASIFEITPILDSVCGQQNGFWGQLEAETIGCFFAGVDDTRCMGLAQQIQEKILQQKNQTVSIGVGVFPMIDYARQDIVNNARKALAHAAFLGPNSAVLFDAVSLNISGDAYYQKGDVANAVKEFQTALMLDAENVNVHNSLGVCYGVRGSLHEALHSFESAISLDAGNVMAHYNAGYVYTLLEQNDKAMEHFLKADAGGEEVFEVIFQIGKLYLEMGDPAKGEPFLRKAVTISPDSGIASFHMGECCEALGKKDQAKGHYETAVKKNPNDAAALSALGALYDEKGENPEISTMFCEKSVEISPENGLFQYRLGCVYANHDQPAKALDVFETAIKHGYDATAEMERVRERLGYVGREGLSN